MPHTDCEVLERILVKDFYLKIIISDQRPYFIKDFPQRFLAKQLNIHGTHGRHGFSLKIIFPYKFRLNSDDLCAFPKTVIL